jgi:hypothetical protein
LIIKPKEAILNSPLQSPFTPAAATASAILNIKGFGTFDPTKITGAVGRRYSAEQLEKMAITCPTAAALGIATTAVAIPVIVNIRINSVRQASETAIDFIKKGRPLVLELKIDGGSTAATVATALDTAIDELKFKYPNSFIPLTSAISGNDVVITATEGIYTFGDTVTFIIRGEVLPYTAATTKKFITTIHVNQAVGALADHVHVDGIVGLRVGDTISFDKVVATEFRITELTSSIVTVTPSFTAAVEAADTNHIWKVWKGIEEIGGGKTLEEVTRMSTQLTSDSYAINPNQVPIIGGKYTMISWSMDVPTLAGGWTSHLNQGAVGAAISNQTFTLYFNEDNALASGGQVELLVTWLDWASTAAFSDFKTANGASSASAAAFIA